MSKIEDIREKLEDKGAYNKTSKEIITDWLAHDCDEKFNYGLTLMPKKIFAGYFRGKERDRGLCKQELESASNRFVHFLNKEVLGSGYRYFRNKLPIVMTIEGEKSYKDLHSHFAIAIPSDRNCIEVVKQVRKAISLSKDFCVYDPNYKFDSSRYNEQYRYKLDITDDGWLYYITKELDKHNLHNLYLP